VTEEKINDNLSHAGVATAGSQGWAIVDEPLEGFIHTDHGKLHYLDWGGQGYPAHLLHANGFCAGTYAPFVRYLRHDLSMMASDIRGHGDSDQPQWFPIKHWRTFAADLKVVIETAMTPPVVGIGHSLGAVTTYIAAATFPDLFSAIVLIDPVFLPRRLLWPMALLKWIGLTSRLPIAAKARRRRRTFRSKAAALKRFVTGRGIFKSWSPEFVEAYLECGLLEEDHNTAILKCDPELEAQIFESVPLDIWTYARRIRCPVLALRGEFSDSFLPDAARRLQRIVNQLELLTIRGTGHFLPMEKPQVCAEAIRDFVKETRG
jgi:pimeloyl-ACP methyl ester carboxylesterase